MKILLCDENRGFGGSERYLIAVAEGLRLRQQEVHVLVRQGSWLAEQLGPACTTTSFSGELDPRALWKLHGLNNLHRFDVVHCHASRDMVVAATLKAMGGGYRLIKSEHCFVGKHRSSLLNWAYRRCDQIWPVSQSLSQQMLEELGPGNTLQVVPNGIKLPDFERNVPERLAKGRWVGYVSSFLPGKGQAEALQATLPLFKNHPDLCLLLGGNGPTRAAVADLVASCDYPERVWMPGHVENPLDYLGGLEVVMLPSREETFSLVCLEAMALAKPVVAYAAGGVPEVVEDGVTGTLVDIGQWADLGKAVAQYLDHPELALQHGQQGLQRVIHSFAMEKILERTLNLYARVA